MDYFWIDRAGALGFVNGFNIRSFLIAIGGASILLFAYRKIKTDHLIWSIIAAAVR